MEFKNAGRETHTTYLDTVLGEKFTYKIYVVRKVQQMNLWGTVNKDGIDVGVEYLEAPMPACYMLIRKYRKGNLVREQEILVGPKSYLVEKLWKQMKLNLWKINLNEAKVSVEERLNIILPMDVEFDKVMKDLLKNSAVRNGIVDMRFHDISVLAFEEVASALE